MPLDVTLVAQGFDMAFLSGAHEMVRSLGGVLEADARIAGTAGAPTLKGTVNWKNGQLGLMGLGEYRDIQVALDVTEERIQVQRAVRAGAAPASCTSAEPSCARRRAPTSSRARASSRTSPSSRMISSWPSPRCGPRWRAA